MFVFVCVLLLMKKKKRKGANKHLDWFRRSVGFKCHKVINIKLKCAHKAMNDKQDVG